ncbi:hypothetical protein FHL15_006934 [Xylaria flabelliformis]|uniref:SprT-like domain-containing protein n=1 Tax=Xylaria flabelliformis TaxID=2512241 RepID=A0A553HVV1_9PEZI|nr:hypothetical protein FHL15_006934 [Xylaria flabelliformis]
MSYHSSLSQDSKRTVEEFYQRSLFWLQVPGIERYRFWETDNPGKPYSHPASNVVQFTQANCLATTAAHDSEAIVEFKAKLYTDSEMSKVSHFEGSYGKFLSEYLVWIDHLFFFGLITHPTRHEGRLVAGKPIITLATRDHFTDLDGNDLNGQFFPHAGELCLGICEPSGELKAMDKAIATVVHELVHVYLLVLTRDSSASRYFNEVYEFGHGVQFHELLQFILTQLSLWMPTIPYFAYLAKATRNDLRAALARPVVSDDAARSLIYADLAPNE